MEFVKPLPIPEYQELIDDITEYIDNTIPKKVNFMTIRTSMDFHICPHSADRIPDIKVDLVCIVQGLPELDPEQSVLTQMGVGFVFCSEHIVDYDSERMVCSVGRSLVNMLLNIVHFSRTGKTVTDIDGELKSRIF
ncbi:hypothetical protein [Ruminococcus sp.]|uniref:hypothetical protein n=1 Tax=Ruminococcus sp. TaxID=41978 RepID=UPI001B41BFC1|nr:hypothetical protein [Ruminococcus sp.]MBP5433765.1 hypothetical protein [Ruminococcus sp.]